MLFEVTKQQIKGKNNKALNEKTDSKMTPKSQTGDGVTVNFIFPTV